MKLSNVSNKTYDGLRIENKLGIGIEIKNCNNIKFINCVIKNCKGEAFNISSSNNITIDTCDFENIRSGVYAVNSKNIKVNKCNCKNVQGPKPRGQFVQFNNVSGNNNYIKNSYVLNELKLSNPEDAINLYKSNGDEKNPIFVENNYISGGGPSKSGGGIMLGDNGGSNQIARNNIVMNGGQYGIACAGGTNIQIINNRVFSKSQPFCNVGIYVWKQRANICDNILVKDNRVGYYNKNSKSNGFWNGNNATNLVIQNNQWNLPYQVINKPANCGN